MLLALKGSSPRLSTIQAARYGMNDAESIALLSMAQSYKTELLPIRAEVTSVLAAFHATLANSATFKDADHTPPSRLTELQQQEDALTLRYRDRLRNSMREERFQAFHKALMAKFGATEAKQ